MNEMTKDMIVFMLALVAIVIIFKMQHAPATVEIQPQPVDPFGSNIPTPENTAIGPEYLTYNTPYMFSPPVQNVLPIVTSGQIGEAPSVTIGCGC